MTKIMAHYLKLETTGSIGSIILGLFGIIGGPGTFYDPLTAIPWI